MDWRLHSLHRFISQIITVISDPGKPHIIWINLPLIDSNCSILKNRQNSVTFPSVVGVSAWRSIWWQICIRGWAAPKLLAYTQNIRLSKQNRICALWWFRGFKSLALEFSVWCCLVVYVASGRLWFCELAGEWHEKEPRGGKLLGAVFVRLKNINRLSCEISEI